MLECSGSAKVFYFLLMLGMMHPCTGLLAVATKRDVLLKNDYSCGQGQQLNS